ncbi:WD40 repeat domain-containing protein [Ideonella sp. YS5]|uniref:WD40 repeat domain-containing protein n=1 Tax=Ideonella sp. YS5 TaxID=3453714 RepID=UPI003EE93391
MAAMTSGAKKVLALLVLVWAALAAPVAQASGRPDIAWSEAGHGDAVTELALSPDGTVLATSSRDKTVKLWRYPHGGLLRTLVVPYEAAAFVAGIESVRFSPDGGELFAAVNRVDTTRNSPYGDVVVFRVGSGAPVRTLARQAQGIAAIDVSRDGAWLASAGPNGTMVWRLADGKLVKALTQHPGRANDVAFAPVGKRLCAGFADGHLVSWRTTDWSLQWDVKAHDDEVTRAVLSPDGTRVATTSYDFTARSFDAANGTLKHTMTTDTGLFAAVFSPDGADLATGGWDGRIRLWSVAEGTLIRRFARSGGSIESLRYASDGSALMAGGFLPSRLSLWDPADGSRLRTLTRLASAVSKVVISQDSKWVAIAASFDAKVDVFHAGNGRRAYSWKTQATRPQDDVTSRPPRESVDSSGAAPLTQEAEDVAFSPTQPLVALPGPDNTVIVRRLSDGETVRTLVGHEERVIGLAFSHDGQWLASGSYFPGSIRLWRTSDWTLVREIKGGIEIGAFGPFASLSFSPDDSLLGSVAEAAPLVLRVADGSVVAHPPGLSRTATFSPDGRLFVISGGVYLDEVRIFRTGDWSLWRTLPGGANDVAFTPDGKQLLAAQFDALRYWRTSDWTPAKSYDEELGYAGAGGGVQSVAISADGELMAYGRYDAALMMTRRSGVNPSRSGTDPGSAMRR